MKKLMPLLTALLAVLLMGGEAFAYIPAQNPSTAQILVLISDSATTQRAYADTTTHTKASGRTTNNQRVGSLTVDTNATVGGVLSVLDSTILASLRVGTRVVSSMSVLDSGLTGYASIPTDTMRVSADFYNVCLYQVAGWGGTSNTTGLTIGHIPAAYRPSHALTFRVYGVTNNGVTRSGYFAVATTGIITVGYDSLVTLTTATFTAAGSKGVSAGIGGCYSRF